MSSQLVFGVKPKAEKTPYPKEEIDAIIEHYAIEQGIRQEDLKRWYKLNYARNIKAARALLEYAGTVELSKGIITACRIDRAAHKLDWSLAGDVLRNVHKFEVTKTKGDSWH